MRNIRYAAVIVLTLLSSIATACPDGQYNQCLLGACACLPNSGTVAKAAQAAVADSVTQVFPDTLNIAGAVVKGNFQDLSQAIGKTMIDTCQICGTAANITVTPADRPFIEGVVGRGFIEYVTTEDPVLVLADAATSAATRVPLKAPIPVPPVPASPTHRPTVYKASSAFCLIQSSSKSVTAGWVNGPRLVSEATKKAYTYPRITLEKNDIIDVTSDNKNCPLKSFPQQQAVTHARIIYETDAAHSGGGAHMHSFILGKNSL